MNATIKKLIPVFIVLPVVAALGFLHARQIIAIPQSFTLGSFTIATYSLTATSGILLATYVFHVLRLENARLRKVDVVEGLLFVLVPALVGARAYHVISDFHLYHDNLSAIFAINAGGVGIIGGVIGGALGAYVYARWKRLPIVDILGLLAVAMPVGQIIGRLGNAANYEILGLPTSLPWAWIVPEGASRVAADLYPAVATFHPLFLYEMILNFVLFMFLFRTKLAGWRRWQLLTAYLVGYGIIRFSLDFLRIEGNNGFGGLTFAQWGIGVGIFLFLGYRLLNYVRYKV